MRILILGASGMLGHKLGIKLSKTHDVLGTVRKSNSKLEILAEQFGFKISHNVDANEQSSIQKVIQKHNPEIIINCIGIVKQLKEASNSQISIAINALLPHQLAEIAQQHGAKLIHFSTDCVFSGKQGPYKNNDHTDVHDLYGLTKYLGEVRAPAALTLRTSIIGQEIGTPTGLIEWFLSNKGNEVSGFKNALYTGLTTNAMADLIQHIIVNAPEVYGLHHASSEEISKYDLLQITNSIFQTNTTIHAEEKFHCDRRLDGASFRKLMDWQPPSWETMIKTMFTEDAEYYKSITK